MDIYGPISALKGVGTKTIEKLNKIKDEYSKIIQKKRIMVCSGTGCTSSKSDVLLKNIQDKLEKDGHSVAVIDMFTLKPIDKDLIIKYAKQTGKIVTCENHSIHNGLGSAVAEVLSENYPVKMKRVGINEIYGQVGTLDFLMKEYGLTSDNIYEEAKKLLG